jgi:hypothetical protein
MIIYTDHYLNILYGKLLNDHIIRWIPLPEEYGPKYVHITGENNIVVDALSRLEKDDDKQNSETEAGLVLPHAICSVEQDEEIVRPEIKEELVMNITNLDEME